MNNRRKYGSLAENSQDWIQEVSEESYQDLTEDETDITKIKQFVSEKEVR